MRSATIVGDGDPAELATIAAEVVPEPAPTPAAAGAGPGADDPIEGLIDQAEALAADPRGLSDLTEDELASVFELGFGLVADQRGRHWEMPAESPSAKRLAKWIKKAIERHGGLPAWLEKWFPDVMALLLVSFEISKRVGKDREIAAAASRSGETDRVARPAVI